MRCTLAILAFLLPLASLDAQSTPTSNPEQAVRAVVDQVFEGMRRADSSVVRPLFHPKARMITVAVRDGVPTVQVEESVDAFIRAVGRPRTEVWDERLSNVRVSIDGPLASVWADYSFYRGTTFSHCGIDHFLLVQHEGAWRIIELSDTRRTTGCAG